VTSTGATTHYYVPHAARWPIFGSISLFTLLLGTALWLDDFKAGPWFALVGFGFVVLMLVGWCIALFVMGFVLRFGNGAEILCWGLLFVIVALSGAFYPVHAMPGPPPRARPPAGRR